MDAYDRISGSLSGVVGDMPTAGPPPGPGSGGKFSFSPGEMEAIVKDWTAVADGYYNSLNNMQYATDTVTAPASDIASEMHAQTAKTSLSCYMESLAQKMDYSYTQAQKFQDALSDYHGVDRTAVKRLDAAGGPMTPSLPGGI